MTGSGALGCGRAGLVARTREPPGHGGSRAPADWREGSASTTGQGPQEMVTFMLGAPQETEFLPR